MVPVSSYENMLEYLKYGPPVPCWMCGLLFAPPKTPIGQSIMDRLDDWHHRSGENFDFFCVGYIETEEYEDDVPVGRVTARDGSYSRQFYYSARAFNDIRDQVAARSGWRYSGEADLLLTNAVVRQADEDPTLDLEHVVALDIDRLIRDGVYSSAARLMEAVCLAADAAALKGERLETFDFSDRQFMKTLWRRTLGAVVRQLKLDAPLSARHFLVGAQYLDAN